MVQKYQNEIAPIFYYGISTKTKEKDLKIHDLHALTLGRVKKITLYNTYTRHTGDGKEPRNASSSLTVLALNFGCADRLSGLRPVLASAHSLNLAPSGLKQRVSLLRTRGSMLMCRGSTATKDNSVTLGLLFSSPVLSRSM